MATDNTVLNVGSGGDTIRDLADSSNVKWPVAVACYATALGNGSNVLQVVTASGGLPVAQQGTWNVGASQTGTWSVQAQDGSGHALTSLGVGSQRAITVAVVDASGNQVTSFGGGGSGGSSFGAPFPATGTAIGAISSGGNLAGLNIDSSGNLKVLATPSGTYTVSGTVGASQSGAWNVGQSGSWAVNSTLQPGTSLIGTVSATDETSTIYSGTTALTPQFASFTIANASGAGATQIVAATAGKRIRILRYSVEFSSTVNFNLQSHTTTSLSSGIKYGIANKTSGGAYCPVGIVQTAAGEALDGYLSGNGTVSGELTYILV